jgi:hypothetical protein
VWRGHSCPRLFLERVGGAAMLNKDRRKRQVWLFVGTLFGMFCLAYGCLYVISTMPDPDVVSECRAIGASVESRTSLPSSVSAPNSPAFFCDKETRGAFFRPFDHVRIYRVVDRTEQDTVTDSLVHARQRLRTKPIIVDFYEKENWTTWSDPATGRSGGERGPETPIRQLIIK